VNPAACQQVTRALGPGRGSRWGLTRHMQAGPPARQHTRRTPAPKPTGPDEVRPGRPSHGGVTRTGARLPGPRAPIQYSATGHSGSGRAPEDDRAPRLGDPAARRRHRAPGPRSPETVARPAAGPRLNSSDLTCPARPPTEPADAGWGDPDAQSRPTLSSPRGAVPRPLPLRPRPVTSMQLGQLAGQAARVTATVTTAGPDVDLGGEPGRGLSNPTPAAWVRSPGWGLRPPGARMPLISHVSTEATDASAPASHSPSRLRRPLMSPAALQWTRNLFHSTGFVWFSSDGSGASIAGGPHLRTAGRTSRLSSRGHAGRMGTGPRPVGLPRADQRQLQG